MTKLVMLLVAAAAALAQAGANQGPPSSVEQTDLVAQLTLEYPQNAGSLARYQLVTTGVESLTAVHEIILPATVSFCDGGSGSDQYSGVGQYDPVSGGAISSPSSANGTGLAQLRLPVALCC